MKLQSLFFGTLIATMCLDTLGAKTTVNLQKAFDNRCIKAKAICTGGLNLEFVVTNLLNDSLTLILPAGWRFNSNDPKNDYQDILVTHQEYLSLKSKATKKFYIKGYCCEATKSGPVQGIAYTLGKMADTNLVKLAWYLNTNHFDSNTEQCSVWAISDKQETGHISCKNDSMGTLLRRYVANIKGEPIPWFTLLKRVNISNFGDVSSKPVSFNASINIVNPEVCYVYCYIVDSSGQYVSQILGNWLLAGEKVYIANFNVAHLKKGTYKLVMMGKKTPLFERSFNI